MAKILIVEDNTDLLEVMRQLIGAEHDVITATDGEEGIAKAAAHQPDLVILDLQLPRMSGVEAGRWIKRHMAPRIVPILALTGLTDSGDPAAILRAGCCDAYLAKPASLPELRARIHGMLADAEAGRLQSRVSRASPRRLGLLAPDRTRRDRGPIGRYPYAVGDRIGADLTVIGHLAQGRWGHLYQVWSTQHWCAFTCKIVAPDLAHDRRATAALRREGRILRGLHHPNVITSFGSGDHEGIPYLLLEYVDGPSLFDVLERQPKRRLAVADALRAAVHVGAGLHHVHQSGFVHLDLKPANLLLRDSLPVLVDFDVARKLDPPRRPLKVEGTGPYMPPELVRRLPPTPAADVYGLGAALYELLTGRWPYEEVYTRREPRSGMERQYPQLGPAGPPPPRQFNREIPQSLEATVLRCLARSPADRFPSMNALLLALTSELSEPVALWPERTALAS
jgi:CheY-like chemotaxis protein